MSGCQSLPVLMYHYISHFLGAITVSPEVFEDQCRGMAQAGWHGVSLAEAEDFLIKGTPLPKRSVLITFDDGFLDNYVYAFPILQKYGHKGVIFAVTGRLRTDGICHHTLKDLWTKQISSDDLPPIDTPMHTDSLGHHQRKDLFLSWEEARQMEKSGVISLAAHTARHLAIYASSEILTTTKKGLFLIPQDHFTTFYKIAGPTPWGMPHFKERPALYTRAFRPSPALLEAVHTFVPQDEAEAHRFFRSETNKAKLADLIKSFESLGSMESDDSLRRRIRTELRDCAETLDKELGHPVRSLCWPWGRGSEIAQEEAMQAGFNVFFETRMGANPPQSPTAVRRFKVRNRGWSWLRLRLEIYSRPLLANIYAKCRI